MSAKPLPRFNSKHEKPGVLVRFRIGIGNWVGIMMTSAERDEPQTRASHCAGLSRTLGSWLRHTAVL